MTDSPLELSEETKRRIQDRAYYLWEQDGRPEGQSGFYWERARELQAIADNPKAGQKPNPSNIRDPILADVVIEEAEIQQNLGEFPHGGLSDQGDHEETPRPRKRATKTSK